MGTWQTFDVGGDAAVRQRLAAVLARFVERGGSLIDSSPMYGRAERVVGDLVAEADLRPRLFVATKVWTTGKATGVAQMEESFARLRVKTMDLMQVHNLVDVQTHLDTLEQWKASGRVRYFGITHYTASSHDAVAQVLASRAMDFLQINYSALERDAERTLLPLARDRGVAVIVNRPFAEGGLFKRLRGRPLPGVAAALGCRTWAELLLKFVISHPAVTCVIPATSDPAHLEENMRAASGPLPDEKMREEIASVVRTQ